MTYPAYDTSRVPESLFAIGGGPVTCASCGCRLAPREDGSWGHFAPMDGRDARGCRVPCADAAHDRKGRPAA